MKHILRSTLIALTTFSAIHVFADTPAEKPFSALVLPATSGKDKGPSGAYDLQIKELGIKATRATIEDVESGKAFENMSEYDMLLVPPPFDIRITNGVEKIRKWLKDGGMFFLHDAVYQGRMNWLADIDPVLALKASGNCSYSKMTPVEPIASVLTIPRRVNYGGYWGHLQCPTTTVWKAIVNCPHSEKGHCHIAVAKYGKGVILAHAQWQGDTTALIVNLRANAALIANDLALTSLSAGEPVAGDNLFSVTVKNNGDETKTIELVFNRTHSIKAEIAPNAEKTLELPVKIVKRGPMTAKLELVCEGQRATIATQDVIIKELLEVGTTRYRNLLSPGRRFEDIQFLSTVSPIDEDIEGAKIKIEVLKDDKVISTRETPSTRGTLRTVAHFPKDLAPGDYTVRGTLIARNGNTLCVNESTVTILKPVPGLTCIDEDMNFIIDEEPFLPIGMYHTLIEQYDEMTEMGVNMIQQFGWYWSISITEAFKRGLRVNLSPFQFSNKGNVGAYAHNPGLMMWYLLDEPSEGDIPRGKALNADFHKYDKNHPTFLCSCTPDKYDRFGKIADVFAPDPYPHHWDNPGIVGRWMDKAFEVCGDRNPLICIPQSHMKETNPEWIAMTHLALCHRSRGVFWYCWSQSGGGPTGVGIKNNPEHRRDLPDIIGRIRAMEPALLNSAETDYFVKDGVDGMSCRDPELGTRYMLVVNPLTNGAPAKAQIEWKGANKANKIAKGAFGYKDFPMKDGFVSVTLDPLEVRILAVDGEVPAPVVLPPVPAKPEGRGQTLNVGDNAKYKTIQAAIDAARPGDEIIVAPGTYTPFKTKNDYLTIRSEKGATETIIDANGKSRCVELTARPFGNLAAETNTVIIGFTFRNGIASATRFHKHRGGLAIGGTYRECAFTGGDAQYGGGIAYATIEKCQIEKNHASKSGGGAIFVTANECEFSENTSDFDAGALSHSTVSGCHLVSNKAGRYGGGITYSTVYRTHFDGNYAGRSGGGSFNQDGYIRNCLFTDNEAGAMGGGAWWSLCDLCTFVGNKAPSGAGFSLVGSGRAEGCIFWQNDIEADRNVNNSLIGVDPKFEKGTYRPSGDSPAIDMAGINVAEGEVDFDGNPRLKGVSTDAGAFETGARPAGEPLEKETAVYTYVPQPKEEELPGAKEEIIDLGDAAKEGLFKLPENKSFREMKLYAKFRGKKRTVWGEIIRVTCDNKTAIRVGVDGRNGRRMYGAVDYLCILDSGKPEGSMRDRTKLTPNKPEGKISDGEWHEIVFTINAYGQEAEISEFLYDGIRAEPNYPWCRTHRQILQFSNGQVKFDKKIEFEKIELSVK